MSPCRPHPGVGGSAQSRSPSTSTNANALPFGRTRLVSFTITATSVSITRIGADRAVPFRPSRGRGPRLAEKTLSQRHPSPLTRR
jgi:hypothetical protein